MSEAPKPVNWVGASSRDFSNTRLFTTEAQVLTLIELDSVRRGLAPKNWKPVPGAGSGVMEIKVDTSDGWYRTIYVAKYPEGVYVLHCFKKKSNRISKKDFELIQQRFKQLNQERSSKK